MDYQYDDNGRLIRETSSRNNDATYHGTYDFTYRWDAADNATTFRSNTKNYNANNQLSDFAYDADGNPLIAGMAFDAENRLTANHTIGGNDWKAGYRGDGLRGWRWVPDLADVQYFTYDGTHVVGVDYPSLGIPDDTRRFAFGYGPNGLVQLYMYNAGLSNGSYTYTFDPLGRTVQCFFEPYSYAQDTYVYDAFGVIRGKGIVTEYEDPCTFAGQWGAYNDWDTGLILMGYRYYDPATGRFLTRDPISYDGGANLYTYCGGNPVNNIDPDGLFLETLWDVGMVIADSYFLARDYITGAPQWQKSLDATALGLDTGAALLPCIPGGGGRALALAGAGSRVLQP